MSISNHKFITCVIALITLFIFSCEEEEDKSMIDEPLATPWENRLYSGRPYVNGQILSNLELQSSTSYDLQDQVCQDELPEGSLQDFILQVYIPTHPEETYFSGIIVNNDDGGMTVSYQDGSTENIYVSGSLEFIGRIDNPNGEGELSGFQVSGYTSSTLIMKENFYFVDLRFILSYKDENENTIHNSNRYLTVFNATCP